MTNEQYTEYEIHHNNIKCLWTAFLWNFQSKILYGSWILVSSVPISRWILFFFLYSIYWLSTIFVVVPVFHETICIFYMEFNSHSCPERKERKTEILNYCRCQSPLRTVIPFISTLNWIYFHFIHLFMGHEKLLLIFLHRFEHRAELLVAPLVCIYDVSDIHKCGTPQSKSLTFHTEIHQETKWGKH